MFCFGVFIVNFFLIQTLIAEFPSIKNIDLFFAKKAQLLSPQHLKRPKIISLSKISFKDLFQDFQEHQHICSSSKLLNNNQIELNSEDLYYLIDSLTYFNCTDAIIEKNFLKSIKEQSKSPKSIYYLSLVKNLIVQKELKSVLNDLNRSSKIVTTDE
ncbi:hypothetical protein MXB_1762 [Myxobolus squamalis]|nr:hypothetical protein MXB_1762 [Myxobolus squamalis]